MSVKWLNYLFFSIISDRGVLFDANPKSNELGINFTLPLGHGRFKNCFDSQRGCLYVCRWNYTLSFKKIHMNHGRLLKFDENFDFERSLQQELDGAFVKVLGVLKFSYGKKKSARWIFVDNTFYSVRSFRILVSFSRMEKRSRVCLCTQRI